MTASRNFIAAALLVLLALAPAIAGDDAIAIGHKLTVTSSILGEERQTWVYTPEGYEQSDAAYPVVYLLDGDTHFHHATGILSFLARQGRAPEMILVGVLNTDRTRDLTPASSVEADLARGGGGADNFLAFLETELIPVIEKDYRTQPYRILIGHSYGGLLANYALAHKPGLFHASVSISPTLWWDDGLLVKLAWEYLKAPALAGRFLYMTMGGLERERMQTAAAGMEQELGIHALDSFRWSYHVLADEDHGSVVHRSIYGALETLFDQWRFPIGDELAGQDGLQRIQDHYRALSDRFGFSILPPEGVINRLGYFYLGQEDPTMAIKVFAYNLKQHPKSANVYDSLGDGYKAGGNLKKALRNYRKAVKLGEKAGHRFLEAFRQNVKETQTALDAS